MTTPDENERRRQEELRNWEREKAKLAAEDHRRRMEYDQEQRETEKARQSNYRKERAQNVRFALYGVVAFLLLVSGGLYGCPQYNVWQQHLAGRAALRRAEEDRKIKIEEARAQAEAAEHLAAAEITRAGGVAEANQIIGKSLQGNEAYLRYLWILGLQDGSSETIYIPTEANLPILEATRRERP